MKTLGNRFTRLSIAAMLALGLMTACSQVKTVEGGGQGGGVAFAAPPDVALINAKPEVVWNSNPKANKITKGYNTQFRVPDQYFSEEVEDWHIDTSKISRGLILNIPDLKPLSNEKRNCYRNNSGLSSCYAEILDIHSGHDLNRQDFKDDGIDENNYLNYHFDKNRRESDSGWALKISLFSISNEHGLISYHSLQEKPVGNKTRIAPDTYFKKDTAGNVLTEIECTNIKFDKEYIGLGTFAHPTCSQSFVLKKHKMVINIKYQRKYLPQWQQIQTAVESIINQFNQAAITEQGVK